MGCEGTCHREAVAQKRDRQSKFEGRLFPSREDQPQADRLVWQQLQLVPCPLSLRLQLLSLSWPAPHYPQDTPCAILCCAVLCSAMLCHAVLCYTCAMRRIAAQARAFALPS